MLKTLFGKTGLHVSPLGFGAAEIGFLKPDRDRTVRMLNFLLDQGLNVIDTAAGYDDSEEIIGEGIGHRRGEYVLISKCGHKVAGTEGESWSASMIGQTVDRSLRRLRTDVLDAMLLHTCDEATLRRGEAIAALAAAKKAGKIRFAGFSGDNQSAAYAASLPEVDVIETSINITDQANIEQVLPLTMKHNIAVLAKRPLANGCWKDINSHPGFFKEYTRPYTERLAKMNISPADFGISGPPETAWPELAIRFTISQSGVHTSIIGTTNPQNAQRNLDAVRKGPLPKQTVDGIRAAFAAAQADGQWPGLT